MGYPVQQSTTTQPLVFFMADSSDHVTGKTGLSPTVTISKNGAAFASPAGAVSEIGSGWYKVAGNATDNATLGPLALYATSAGADPTKDMFSVVAFNPQDAAALGMSRIDAAISSRMATFTVPTNFGSLSISSGGVVQADVAAVATSTTGATNLKGYLIGTHFMPVDAFKPVFSVSGTTLTVKEPDGTTTAYTKTLTTNAAAVPVVGAS